MRIRQFGFTRLSASLTTALFLGSSMALAQQAQMPSPQGTSMMVLQVIRGQDGNQYVVTRSGIALPIPAPGVAANATEMSVYRDQDGNFWYNNAYGQGVRVTAQQIQWKLGQIYGHGPIPGGTAYNEPYVQRPYPSQQGAAAQAPAQAPVQQTTIYQQPAQQSSGSSGSSALATGLAAAGGGMLGGIIAGSLYNDSGYEGGVPYGVPLYRGANGQPYYNGADGHPVYVNQNNYNQKMFNDWNKQTNWADAKNNWDKNHSNQPLNPNQQQQLKQDAQNYKGNQKGDQQKDKRFGRRNRDNDNNARALDGSGARQFQNVGRNDGGGRRFGGGGGRFGRRR